MYENAVPVKEGLFTLPSSPGEPPRLIGCRCKACGETFFPQRGVCIRCLQDDLEQVHLSTRGKLHTFCVVRQAPPGLKVPYAMGITELPEGVRITSLIATATPETLKVDMEMELVIEGFRQNEEGKEVLAYKFRPVS
ncbi:MAG: OB-fold domain-containing protein [Candidatus Tectomicrobia bacterium]|uniref:OB-fold domain-containing protein n=1 Tax=Tectimicrobiota bacterium TaxID=2528274 RepID=A0A932CP88_UNCTE|nr:OB-fold domain-containing protein [Candidatus Tectomicrobia bacterium]